ncbi:CREB3 regulatory factor [Polypterus senegalus]|uniref:CREB3 regulatory factor n=1 Tax=Polypterus senegalus TaxID=55291 RepID=UPI0019664D2B|nr:CREB3 regulatory factor [Polypterus senegalus]XP_039632449.1 CREB3 regulatory factor [Polypterus senegalus]XP_039632450.1 CREB3 regulatory factor [Polypterus senegalus]
MPQPSISGMDPPFGDAFQNHTFADQALTSTDLLSGNSDPDFIYEVDREMSCRQSPRCDIFAVGDCKDVETIDHLTDVLDGDPTYFSNFEQWDTYWEDLTKYTKLASCDIWGTKEVDFLGLDDLSSPYQDEEVIGKTPTLAQLNSEDSQPVSDLLCYTDMLLSQKPNTLASSLSGKKMTNRLLASAAPKPNNLPDYADVFQKATRPVPSSTETISKTQIQSAKVAALHSDSKDYVRKAKVRISTAPLRPAVEATQAKADITIKSSFNESKPVEIEKKMESSSSEPSDIPEKSISLNSTVHEFFPGQEGSQVLLPGNTMVTDHSQKKEEHNYSLFVTEDESEQAGKTEEDIDEEEDADELELEDEDHDEGFGSEHEFSENDEEEEEEEEEEDYEDDKDEDMSDTFSEPGCENDQVEDLKGVTTGFSRKRGKRRYFWEYSEQLTPSKQERMLTPSEWDRDTLPSNMYQKNGLHHGKYTVKKSRRTDVEDLTPNPRKLLQIGNELRKLNKVISDLTPVSELPLTARPRSRKEKNKLASRACRLKKKAQYEANKVKLWGLNTEYDRLLFVINAIKQEIVTRIQLVKEEKTASMTENLEQLIKETLVNPPVAGQTSDFVNQILEKTAGGDPTGGLVGLRVPTSKV